MIPSTVEMLDTTWSGIARNTIKTKGIVYVVRMLYVCCMRVV